jgi:transporter family protein
MWLVYAVLSSFFAGITAVLVKVGVENTNSNLLTALRTIAGSIGMSVFIGIMSSYNSTTLSVVESSMKGVNLAFLFMGIGCIVLLGISIFGLNNDTYEEFYETSESII